MEVQYTVVTKDFINVLITSTSTSFASERRFQKKISIAEFKAKLELITGVSAANMKLEAYTSSDSLICQINDNDALLGSYPVDDGVRIHVTDLSNKLGFHEDNLKDEEKFTLTEEEYSKKPGTMKAFLMAKKLGKYAESREEMLKQEEELKIKQEEEEKQLAENLTVGSRCEVRVTGLPTRRGEIMFVGAVHFKPGYWVGIKYDEPMGKNDGSVESKRYFQCLPKYGGFVKPQHVTAGDFPEENIDLDDDEM